jgi:hypothetical protein
MRLWTIHPKYLDASGLVALWREALLAQAVLGGRTKGYRHHPQLYRFREHDHPTAAINAYLGFIFQEAEVRGYRFNSKKVNAVKKQITLQSTSGQLGFEWKHLLKKFRLRSPDHFRKWRGVSTPEPHPLFMIETGAVESWERGND